MMTVPAYKRVRSEMKKFSNLLGKVVSVVYEDVLKYLPKKKRKLYKQVVTKMSNTPYHHRDTLIKIFDKIEKRDLGPETSSKHYENTEGQLCEDTRPVQPRSLKFNVRFSRHLGPIEKKVFGFISDGTVFPPGQLFAKGMTPDQVYDALLSKWNEVDQSSLEGACALVLDVSRWDRHIRGLLHKLEADFLKHMNDDDEFHEMVDSLARARGVARHPNIDLNFSGPATRCSGDMHTSLMNHVLMTCIMCSFFRMIGIKYQLLDAGDDIVVIIPRENYECVQEALPEYFSDCGLSLKVETATTNFHEIKFCQCRPFAGKMVRSFARITNRSLVCPNGFLSRQADYLYSVFLCELHLNHNVPVIGPFCKAMVEQARIRGGNFSIETFDDFKRDETLRMGLVDDSSFEKPMPNGDDRKLYETLTGVSPNQQLELERELVKFATSLKYKNHNKKLDGPFDLRRFLSTLKMVNAGSKQDYAQNFFLQNYKIDTLL